MNIYFLPLNQWQNCNDFSIGYFLELLFVEGLLEHVNSLKVAPFQRILYPRFHQVSEDHLLLEIQLQLWSQFLMVEQLLIVIHIDALLFLYFGNDFEFLIIFNILLYEIQEGWLKSLQKIFHRMVVNFSSFGPYLFIIFCFFEVLPLLGMISSIFHLFGRFSIIRICLINQIILKITATRTAPFHFIIMKQFLHILTNILLSIDKFWIVEILISSIICILQESLSLHFTIMELFFNILTNILLRKDAFEIFEILISSIICILQESLSLCPFHHAMICTVRHLLTNIYDLGNLILILIRQRVQIKISKLSQILNLRYIQEQKAFQPPILFQCIFSQFFNATNINWRTNAGRRGRSQSRFGQNLTCFGAHNSILSLFDYLLTTHSSLSTPLTSSEPKTIGEIYLQMLYRGQEQSLSRPSSTSAINGTLLGLKWLSGMPRSVQGKEGDSKGSSSRSRQIHRKRYPFIVLLKLLDLFLLACYGGAVSEASLKRTLIEQIDFIF